MWRFLFILSGLYLIAACTSQSKDQPKAALQSNNVILSHVQAYLLIGNIEKAEERFAVTHKPEQDPDALLVLAELRAAKGDHLGAQQAFLQSINHREPTNTQASPDLLAYLCSEKKWQMLLGYVAGLENSNLSIDTKNQQLSAIGRCFFTAEYWQDAHNSLSKLDFNQQVDPFVYLALARLNIEQNQYKQAQQSIDKFKANLTQVDAEILWRSFEVYSALQQPRLARQSAQQLVTLFPNHEFTQKYLLLRKGSENALQEVVYEPPVLPVEHKALATIHVIKSSETLYQLSKRYHVSVADLLKWNPNLAVDDISVGSPIRVAKD